MKNNKAINIGLIILSLVIIGSILIWAPVCKNLVELATGNMTFMKCHYTANASILVAILLIIISIDSIIKKSSRPAIIAGIGVVLFLLTMDSVGIGMCMNKSMSCNTTSIWIKVSSALIILSGLYIGYSNKKSL